MISQSPLPDPSRSEGEISPQGEEILQASPVRPRVDTPRPYFHPLGYQRLVPAPGFSAAGNLTDHPAPLDGRPFFRGT